MSYTTATPIRVFREADGRIKTTIRYTGDAGETPVDVDTYVQPGSRYLDSVAIQQRDALNANAPLLTSVVVGTPLDTTTPIPPAIVPRQRSYMAASLPFTPGATPQDVFTLTGSATKILTVTRIGLCTTQTTAGVNAWLLLKRNTANSGGTSAAVPILAVDGGTPQGSVLQYTVNPTAGNLAGRLWSGRVVSPAPATAGIGDSEKILRFEDRMAPVTLNGIGEVLALNFNGVALPPGLSVTAHVWWTEF